MSVSLSCIARAVSLLIAGAAFGAIGLTGIVSPNHALLIDYANGSPVFNCSGFVFVYGVVSALMGVGVLLHEKLASHYLTLILSILSTAVTVTIIVSVATFNWVVEYGHLAALDAYVRDHDTRAACWTGIVRNDYNSVQGKNCFSENEHVFCATCRTEYYRDEPTFIKSHRFEIVFLLIVLLLINGYTLWKLYLKASDETTRTASASSDESSKTLSLAVSDTDSHYATPKNNRPVKSTYWHNPYQDLLLPPPPQSWMFEDDDDDHDKNLK